MFANFQFPHIFKLIKFKLVSCTYIENQIGFHMTVKYNRSWSNKNCQRRTVFLTDDPSGVSGRFSTPKENEQEAESEARNDMQI